MKGQRMWPWVSKELWWGWPIAPVQSAQTNLVDSLASMVAAYTEKTCLELTDSDIYEYIIVIPSCSNDVETLGLWYSVVLCASSFGES